MTDLKIEIEIKNFSDTKFKLLAKIQAYREFDNDYFNEFEVKNLKLYSNSYNNKYRIIDYFKLNEFFQNQIDKKIYTELNYGSV